jgi:hypothetical protein
MEIKAAKYCTEESIDDYYTKKNKSYVKDGIIYFDKYSKCKPKILWILKESHAKDKSESWDHRGFLGWSLVTNYQKWKNTHGSIVRASHGLLNQVSDVSKIKHLSQFTKEEVDDIMQNIAVINVKKNVGDSVSNSKEICREYNENKEVILGQIELIDPDVIINCSGVSQIYRDYSEKVEGKIFINTYHPAQTTISRDKYCQGILTAVRNNNEK